MYTQKCATFYGCYCCWRSRKRIAISFVCSFTHANKNWNWMCRFDKRIKGIESAFESTYATLYVMAVPFQVSNESLANASQMKATITGRTSSLIQMDYSDVSHRTNGHPPIKWLLSVCNVDFDARLSLSLSFSFLCSCFVCLVTFFNDLTTNWKSLVHWESKAFSHTKATHTSPCHLYSADVYHVQFIVLHSIFVDRAFAFFRLFFLSRFWRNWCACLKPSWIDDVFGRKVDRTLRCCSHFAFCPIVSQ